MPKIVALLVFLLFVAAVSARVAAAKAAHDYGRRLDQAVSMVGVSGFADTAELRRFLDGPEMTAPLQRVRALSFLGGGYNARVDELQRSIIYLSEQMALPPTQRFSSPPTLTYLSLVSSDRTDAGVAEATKKLFSSYESQM